MSDSRTMDCPDCNRTVRMDEAHCILEPTAPISVTRTHLPTHDDKDAA